MKHHGFAAREAMGWLRIVRPGSVIGAQQQFPCDKEELMRELPPARSHPSRPAAEYQPCRRTWRKSRRGSAPALRPCTAPLQVPAGHGARLQAPRTRGTQRGWRRTCLRRETDAAARGKWWRRQTRCGCRLRCSAVLIAPAIRALRGPGARVAPDACSPCQCMCGQGDRQGSSGRVWYGRQGCPCVSPALCGKQSLSIRQGCVAGRALQLHSRSP